MRILVYGSVIVFSEKLNEIKMRYTNLWQDY